MIVLFSYSPMVFSLTSHIHGSRFYSIQVLHINEKKGVQFCICDFICKFGTLLLCQLCFISYIPAFFCSLQNYNSPLFFYYAQCILEKIIQILRFQSFGYHNPSLLAVYLCASVNIIYWYATYNFYVVLSSNCLQGILCVVVV